MGQIMMVKRQCSCGEWDGVALIKEKKTKIAYWYVKCPTCGKTTLKHTEAEGAVREWNHMEDGHE